ncbi:hypothetical protein SAMN05421858_3412 [Haladaptatus litoreus]|uniref:Uncharacterized protein n=1 Tax=Haladaptatus litoreus TaxID=553468 RepID=A0A1N7D1J8_9EURY|nr:hypothetical protein SAMN05421858_3412 [Haladaptatus litoreus]
MPEPDIDFLTIGFDAVAIGVQFAPGLVSESVLQDVGDGAFFPVVFGGRQCGIEPYTNILFMSLPVKSTL